MNEIGAKIMEYGQNKKTENLQKYIDSLNVTELIEAVLECIYQLDGVNVWKYVLAGFTNTDQCHKKRYKLGQAMLAELEKNQLSTLHTTDVIAMLQMHLHSFKTQHLVQIVKFFIEKIQTGHSFTISWEVMLPNILQILIERDSVDYEEDELTGTEFVLKVINILCSMMWSTNIVLPLAKMFLDISLPKEDHIRVINKLVQCMEELTCQEIPPFVYQLLRHGHFNIVFTKLQQYFNTRIYSQNSLFLDSNSNQNSESSDLDAIESASNIEVIQVESTVLFHIQQAAILYNEPLKDYLNTLKKIAKYPEYILHPFTITVLLIISRTKDYCEMIVHDILKTGIATYFTEMHRKSESCWFREFLSKTGDIRAVFKQIIESSVVDRPLIVEGLIYLAFTILGAGVGLSKESAVIVAKQVDLGKFIIVNVVKKTVHISGKILEMLQDNINSRNNNSHYIDCLQTLCKYVPFALLENQSGIIMLLELILQHPGPTADHLLVALMPLIKRSQTVREHLILLLRKALFARSLDTRQMAVMGFMRLLKHIKVNNFNSLSQNTYNSNSYGSYFSQISMEHSNATSRVFDNEMICLELLGILKNCLGKQAEIKAELYEQLYNAVCTNSKLGIPALNMLEQHFFSFYNKDEESLPPLNFSKISSVQTAEIKLMEPLGKLIYCIGLIVLNIKENDDDNATIKRFTNNLESLCDRMTKCELINFELDDGTNLLDDEPVAQSKLFVLKEAIFVCEALIGYKMASWNLNSENCGKAISALFTSYTRLISFGKNLSKPKKIEKGTKRKNEKSQSTAKNSPKPAIKTINIKTTTVLDLKTLNKTISLLFMKSVDWASASEASVIRIKPEFNRYILECALQEVEHVNEFKTFDPTENKEVLSNLTEISSVLYNRCLLNLQDLLDFDCQTAMLAIELFNLIFNTVSKHHKKHIKQFLSKVAQVDENEDLRKHFNPFIETYEKLLNLDLEEIGDTEAKKLPTLVINSFTSLANQIFELDVDTASLKLLLIIKDYAENNEVYNKNAAISILTLLFNLQIRSKSDMETFKHIANQLANAMGVIDEEIKGDVTMEFKIINEAIGSNVLHLMCNSLNSMLNNIHWIIGRLKCEHQKLISLGDHNMDMCRESMKNKERDVTCQLSHIVDIISILTNIQVQGGHPPEPLIKIIIHVYNTLSMLTKHFIVRSTKVSPVFQHSRFDNLVKRAGKNLAKIVYDYLLHIENVEKEEAVTQANSSKKKVDPSQARSKIVRERKVLSKIILEMEQFSKFVLQLSTKTKIDLTKLMVLGTVRDFQLKNMKSLIDADNSTGNLTSDDTLNNTSTGLETNEDHSNSGEIYDSDKENTNDDEPEESPSQPKKKSRTS